MSGEGVRSQVSSSSSDHCSKLRGPSLNSPRVASKERHGGMAERSQLWGRRVPASKPDSTEDLPYMWACCTLNHTQGLKQPPAAVVWKFGEEGARSVVVLVI
ncbi:hypothetical protein AVEN_235790-1 [Araneus ventricosus]|uniref:Uncharacterized protein n=1 Tax=Araneus ventricosus TaxID=182803 RepID=A0A4Y2VM53_ARAVE|nr:hypothetical protein AVEN_235790-1 [Araneus ventricosus]